jgi:hypothetical protein
MFFSFALATRNQSQSDEELYFGTDDRLERQYELQDIPLYCYLIFLMMAIGVGCQEYGLKVGVRTNAKLERKNCTHQSTCENPVSS